MRRIGWPTRSIRSAPRIPGQSPCTITPTRCASSIVTASSSTSRWSTSSAPAAAECRATTTSGPTCTSRASKRWEDLTDDPESVSQLREVYRTIDEVDTMVGLFAEPVPKGFGFSDTGVPDLHSNGVAPAAERPLPDRGLRPEIYSPFGMDWIEQNSMTSASFAIVPSWRA